MNEYYFNSKITAGLVIVALATQFGTQCKLDTVSGSMQYRITLLNTPNTEKSKVQYFIAGIIYAMEAK